MEKKRGFTLVEILATIVILATLVLIGSVSIIAVSKKTKEKMFCTKVETILSAAKEYGEDEKIDTETFVTISALRDAGYLKYDNEGVADIVDPRNRKTMLSNTIKVYSYYNHVYAEYQHSIEDTDLCD